MKLISIVTPCYNEEENVEKLYKQVKDVFAGLPEYVYEHIFIDNASKDRTVEILREIAGKDTNVKVIVNSRNFGPIRSPQHALLQAKGDAAISLVADLQDPPSMIIDFIKRWEEGYKRVVGVKKDSQESRFMYRVRRLYYYVISKLSDTEQIPNSTGFGLYDKRIVDILRTVQDPYPYFRGLMSEIGFEAATIEYVQPARKRGLTKQNFYSLYDLAMLGITSHSKVPLRLATMLGFALAFLNLLIGLGYLIYKLLFWSRFDVGIAPVVIGLFFFASVQLFFIGIIGEYIGSIHTQVLKRPLVIEKERINFD
ncbi:MAG: glycosyltransferase family 2 protein [Deltaproteobacteria bacterium]|nr:glycosyltransferase family 2 protein [Deltaproteobacteria bacterium]